MTTRRDFLKVTSLSGAALVVGFQWSEVFAAEKTGVKSFKPNGWVRIDSDGTITLTVGKSEMGQGVRTSLPMIIAEELEAEWKSIKIVQAEPGPDFKRLGTGGSWSVGGSWKPLREAGAAAREMLIAAAALKWNVDLSTCRAERSTVIHDATGRKLSYGALAADAAKLEVPKTVALKPMKDHKLLGRPTRRLDGKDIVTGKAKYGLDQKAPGMRYATILRTPVIGGKLVSFDGSAAKAIHGVIDVVAVPTGVAIIADNSWSAIKARDAVKVTWNEGPWARFDSREFRKRLEAATTEPGVEMRKDGEGFGAWAGAARKIESKYSYPFYAHAPVEPMNTIADVRDGKCELWSPTQTPNGVQNAVAAELGIKPEAVTVHVSMIGGGFGRRLNTDYAVEAAQVSRVIGKPVQVIWTRQDDMHHGHFQAASVHHMHGGLNAAGDPVSWSHKKVSSFHNLSGKPTPEELKDPAYYRDSAWGVYDVPYGIPALETTYVSVDTHIPIGPWRAVYSPSSTFARESFLDELASAAKKDPIQFRLDLLNEPYLLKAGTLTIDRQRSRRVLEVLREKSGWTKPLPAGMGRGVAFNVYDGDTHLGYVVEASVKNGKPKIHRVVCVVDCGVVVNPLGIEAQVESGVIWGISSAFKGEITFRNGRVEQSSYSDFEVLRIDESPVIETHIIPSHGEQPFGIGEPTVPPIVPAVVNALFAASGKRLRSLPIRPSDFS